MSTTPKPYTYADLKADIRNRAAGIRCTTDLKPADGPNGTTVIFPPTYAVDDKAKGPDSCPYDVSGKRNEDGTEWDMVQISSVAAGANAYENALKALRDDENKLDMLPYMRINMANTPYPDVDIDIYNAPHRVFDATFRDSQDDSGVLFRSTEIGKAITKANHKNMIGMYQHAPTVIALGCWDSSGPKGGDAGSKIERAIQDRIVGYDVKLVTGGGGGRVDPLTISANVNIALQIPEDPATDLQWIFFDETDKKAGKNGDNKAKKPSNVNHGSPPPSLHKYRGGVTTESIKHTSLLSYLVLGKSRYILPERPEGISEQEVNNAARTVIAAIGLVGMTARIDQGFSLRAQCNLIPINTTRWERLGKTEADTTEVTITLDEALDMLNAAIKDAEAVGLKMRAEQFDLTPTSQLVQMINRSRDIQRDPEANESTEG